MECARNSGVGHCFVEERIRLEDIARHRKRNSTKPFLSVKAKVVAVARFVFHRQCLTQIRRDGSPSTVHPASRDRS